MVGIYVRVSTEEQARKGYSIKDQLYNCKRKVPGVEETKEYIDDGISGEFLDRPALNQLRKDVKGGLITVVVCLDPDRLSRKLINQLIISEEIEKKAKLVFVNGEYEKTPEGKLFYQMKGAVSEYEKAMINERMTRGRRQKAREGKVVSNYRIYGYDYDESTDMMRINAYEAEIVRLVFDLFTGRRGRFYGISGIAKYLTGKGIPTKLNIGAWRRQVIRQIILNRAYIGEFYQNKWNCEGMLANKFMPEEERVPVSLRPKEDWILVSCPPIVDKNVFEYAQELLEQSRRRWAGKPKNRYLLSGLVRCGFCGNTMTGVKAKNWGKYVFEYTDRKPPDAKNRGCGKRIKTEELDSIVWETALKWLSQKDKIASEAEYDKEEMAFERAGIQRIESRLQQIAAGRKNLIDFLFSASNIDEKTRDDIGRKLALLANEEESLRKEMIYLENKNNYRNKAVSKNLIEEAAEYYLSKAPEEIAFDDKREMIRMLVKEIRVFEDEIKVFGF